MKRFSDLKVYIVDDDPAILDSLRLLFTSENFMIETYSNSQQFLDRYDPKEGGCLVLDIGMPGMNGLELQKCLLQKGRSIPIVFITGNAEVPQAVQAFKNGAVDFIEKPFSRDSLLEAIQRSLKLSYEQLQECHRQEQLSGKLNQLTQREKQIMEAIIEGKANKVIAYDLGISQRTVETHRASIMQKMGTRSLAELINLTTVPTT